MPAAHDPQPLSTPAPAAGASAGTRQPGRWGSPWLWVLWGAVVLGVALRVVAWGWGRAFNGDELSLWLNLEAFGGWELVSRRLDVTPQTQAAPPIVLWVFDAMHRLVAPAAERPYTAERVARLMPLIASCAAVGATALLAREALGRHLRPAAALAAAAWVALLAATSPRLLTQAQVLKQYSGDVLVAAGLAWFWLWMRNRGRDGFPAIALLAAGAVWVSHTTAFVFASLAVAEALVRWETATGRRARLRALGAWKAWLVPAGLSLVAVYVLSASRQRDAYLSEFWQYAFPPREAIWRWPIFYAEWLVSVFRYQAYPLGAVLLPAAAVGASWLWRRDRALLAVLVGPTLLVGLAAAAQAYPAAAQRVNLFLLPTQLALAGVGLWALPALLRLDHRPRARTVALGVAVVVAVATSGAGLREALVRPVDLRPAADHLAAEWRPGEPILAFGSGPAEHLAVYHPQLQSAAVFGDGRGLPEAVPQGWLLAGVIPGGTRLQAEEAVKRLRTVAPFEVDPTRSHRGRGGEALYLLPRP